MTIILNSAELITVRNFGVNIGRTRHARVAANVIGNQRPTGLRRNRAGEAAAGF